MLSDIRQINFHVRSNAGIIAGNRSPNAAFFLTLSVLSVFPDKSDIEIEESDQGDTS